VEQAKQYDVVVVGGGIAGVAAALQCARSGLQTAIVEKTILWGGLCTSGLVPIYMPLCDGKGRQVTFGIAEELLKASVKYGPGGVPDVWAGGPQDSANQPGELYPEGNLDKRYMTFYSPVAFTLGLDDALAECSADLWLDTLACTPILQGDAVAGVEVENKSGRIAIGARYVIDASGDADIAYRAGAPCEENKLYPSMLYQYTSLDRAKQAVEKGSAERLATWRGAGGANEMGKGYGGPLGKLSATRGKDVSAFVVESRRLAREDVARQQAELGESGHQDFYPVTLPTMAQYRMTRMIQGQETVHEQCNERRDTSIGLIADCRKTDAVWEVPYGALVPRGVRNLLVVGRCVASEGYSWQVTRLIPAAALTGQVAGLATALALKEGTSPDALLPGDVQKATEKTGIVLHL